MRNWLIETFGLEVIKEFNILIFGFILGLLLGFLAMNYDQSIMIKKGYINNIFLGDYKVYKDKE